MMALHRLAHFCVVSSLHDGMNLVAKEFVASRADEDGVLILSQFTGAARELTDALLVNPFAVDEIAEAMQCALRCRRRSGSGACGGCAPPWPRTTSIAGPARSSRPS